MEQNDYQKSREELFKTMSPETFDVVVPLYRCRWNTQAVLEGITTYYSPRTIHVITPDIEGRSLQKRIPTWQVAPISIYPEESFFQAKNGLTKDAICTELKLRKSLYTPGWFYQQLLKLGASEGIDNLSKWYIVWDSDLLPVKSWPLIHKQGDAIQHMFALLQHNQWGNAGIVSIWDRWIRSVLEVKPLTDPEGTFIPHHMWFKQEHLASFKRQLNHYFQSDDHWLLLMMRSANEFGTFSEYWSYVSWVAANHPDDIAFHPYEQYGATTERFFDDGTGLFSTALKQSQLTRSESENQDFSPSYMEIKAFIESVYEPDALPSSLSFESSSRHLKKGKENMHIEELRSRWHLLEADVVNAR